MTAFTMQFLGTGNAWTKPPANFNNNVLVTVNGHRWLIDCGLLCPLAMHNAGVSPLSIDGVFITHLHGDHVFGLEELFFKNFFCPNRRRIRLWLPTEMIKACDAPDGYDIWDNCLRASLQFTVMENDGKRRALTLEDYADIFPMSPHTPYSIFGITCETFHVIHIQNRPSFGLIIDNQVAYTSDCTFSRGLIESLLERGIHTIFHDVSFEPKSTSLVHSSFEDLATLPRDIAQHLVLMHYDDEVTEDQFRQAKSMGFQIASKGQCFSF